jgi:hypothetical protein
VYLILIITCKAKGVLQILIQSRFIISARQNEGYVGVYSLSRNRFFKGIFYLRMGGCELETGFQLDGNRFPVFNTLHFSGNRLGVRSYWVLKSDSDTGTLGWRPHFVSVTEGLEGRSPEDLVENYDRKHHEGSLGEWRAVPGVGRSNRKWRENSGPHSAHRRRAGRGCVSIRAGTFRTAAAVLTGRRVAAANDSLIAGSDRTPGRHRLSAWSPIHHRISADQT